LNADPGAPFPHKALDRSYKAGSCLFNIEVKDQIEALILILGKQIPQCHIEPSAKLSKNTKVGKLQKCQKTLSVYGACGASKKKRYKWMACILPLAHKSRVPNFFIQGAAQLRRFLLSLPGRDSPKLRSEASFYKLQDLGIELLGSWDTLNSLMMTFNHS